MDQLKTMKENLISIVQGQMSNISAVDTKELGEAIDMIKDLAEASYYCKVTEAMEEGSKEDITKYSKKYMPYEVSRDMDRMDEGRMYYADGNMGGSQGGRYYTPRIADMNGMYRTNEYSGSERMRTMPRYYTEDERSYPMYVRDSREGRSPMSRKYYIESKEMHKDKATQMQELEKYMQELTNDITEMINDATPEEKQILQQKLATLSTKIK